MIRYQAPTLNYFERFMKNIGLMVMPKMKPILDRNAGGLANDLARMTPPLVNGKMGTGASAAAYYAGEKSLRNDIYRLFKPLQSIPFASLIKGRQYRAAEAYKFKFNNPSLAKAYAQGDWRRIYSAFANSPNSAQFQPKTNVPVIDAPTDNFHNANRNKKGKVPKNVAPLLVVRGKKAIDAYFQKAKKGIGVMVSGWYWCATRLRARVPTNWTGNKPKGSVTYKVTKTEAGITIANPYGNYNGYFDANKGVAQLAVNHWAKRLKVESEKLIKDEFEKARKKSMGEKPVQGGKP